MSESTTSFGALLRQFRAAAALSQERLAERAGLSRRGISDLERGQRHSPRLETVRMLADALQLSDDDRAKFLSAARPTLFHTSTPGSSLLSVPSLPASLTRLIGREREVNALGARLRHDETRLLTLIGPGGVGKTRLALAVATEAADAFAVGAVFVPLAAVSDSRLVLPTIARALHVRETPGRSLSDALVVALQDRRLLLILDNFEHVLPAAAISANLLQACPYLTILVTSRSRLRVSGEECFTVPPLALPGPGDTFTVETLTRFGAIRLFMERAQSARDDFALDSGDAVVISEICRRLDGLPLAIELAAAWVRVLPPAELLRRLEHPLPVLRGGADDLPDRLRTMRNAIAWSHDLLSEDEARLFRRLGVFVGGFTLDAAELIGRGAEESRSREISLSPSLDVLDLIASLIDKSLLHPALSGALGPRFMMLETVREFALERLEASGEKAAIEAAHAASVLSWAERAEGELLGPNEWQWQADCDAELGNVRAALTWSLAHDAEMALRIAAPLWVYWSANHLPEGRRWLRAALPLAATSQTIVRARALTTDAALACLLGDFASGEVSAIAAAALAQEAGDALSEARARWIIGANRLSRGQTEETICELDRALSLFGGAATPADRSRVAYTRATRAAGAFMLGNLDQGIADFEQALAEVRASGSAAITINILCDFAGWLISIGETSRARGLLREALSLTAIQPVFLMAGAVMVGLALVAAMEGDMPTAAHMLGAVASVQSRTGLVLPAHYQERVNRATALARDALGEEPYTAAWEAGRGDPRAVIANAISDSDGKVVSIVGRSKVAGRARQTS